MFKTRDIQKGIKLLILSTSVRWFGWGLGEGFIPIFLFMFSANFLETGLLASVYNLMFFLFIPIAGFLADNIKAKKMILAALIIYVFIGFGYLLAGLTTAIIFLIFARALNGISYSLDQVGRETYIMRHSRKNKISTTFGYFDTITQFWWIIAVIIGLILVKYIPIHWLFFFIIPTSILSFLIVLNLKEKPIRLKKSKFSLKKSYIKIFKEIKNFNKGLKLIATLSFLIGIISSAIYFFVPISIYVKGGNIIYAVIPVLIYSIPGLFGKKFGKIADKRKGKIYIMGLLSIILLLISLIYFKNYFIILIIMFLASATFELISVTNRGMILRLSDKTHLGEIDGSLNGIASLGAIIGPVLFGLLTDLFSFNKAYLIMIITTIFVLFIIFKGRKNLET